MLINKLDFVQHESLSVNITGCILTTILLRSLISCCIFLTWYSTFLLLCLSEIIENLSCFLFIRDLQSSRGPKTSSNAAKHNFWLGLWLGCPQSMEVTTFFLNKDN